MYENYRMPGEFEKRSNVYVTWLPDYIRAEGFDNRQPCVDVIKALLEYGRCYGQPQLWHPRLLRGSLLAP